jgi:adenylate cyclase class IV
MAQELELKAIVPEPALLRRRLAATGARPGFRGLMEDRRYDRGGELTARDEVLRIRRFLRAGGATEAELTWKGPTRRSADGYKLREELSCRVAPGSDSPGAILEALGYTVIQAIDRWVELFEMDGAVLRIEWYPRMDVLVEVEGAPEAIERAIQATGLPRETFSAEMLVDFVRRYDAREARPAVLAVAGLGGERPPWEAA